MPEKMQNKVNQKTRVDLLKVFPCFSFLSPILCEELAAFMLEVQFKPHDIITRENELVDSVYIIVDGKAEVTRLVKRGLRMHEVPVSVLASGEAIGLNDTGFYSSTGKRTATVTALTNMLLLKIDVKTLYAFFKSHQLETSIATAAQQMLRMRFIKQTLPFSRLTHKRLQWLAAHVEELTLEPNSILFKQGDEGNKCYLIKSGEIEILTERNSKEEIIATLKPPMVFGEATLITHMPRNATARAKTECELLALSHEYLSELLESEENVAKMFMSLTVDRSRPKKNSHVSLHHRTSADGQELVILKNPIRGTYFKLSKEGEFIWKLLDGKHSLQDITLAVAEQFNVFAPNMVAALISKLTNAGFIANISAFNKTIPQTFWEKTTVYAKKLLQWRIAFGDADKWVSYIYQKYIYYFFTKPAQIILLVLIAIGFYAFILNTPHVLEFFSIKHASLWLLLTLLPLSMLAALLHELGHAFAVKAFGREVHYMGVGWSWLVPIAFTDTSDMWLATRKPRMIVNFAGIFVDLLIASTAALISFWLNNPYLQSMLWLFALYVYLGGFRMLSPLQEMDGYYILMDWVEKTRLRQAAVLWLVTAFPQTLVKPKLWKKYFPEISYWIACIIYLISISILTLVVQTFVLTVLGWQFPHSYFTLLLPFAVMLFSSYTILRDIRKQTEEY